MQNFWLFCSKMSTSNKRDDKMDSISNKITDYFSRKNYISEDKKDIYNYGFKLIISDLINFSLVLGLGLVINRFIDGIVFLISLCGIRRFSGGFHAKTFWLCRVSMVFTFLSVIIISNTLEIIKPPLLYIIVFDIISLIVISFFSPVKHPNKKLTKKQCHNNKIKAIIMSTFFTMVSILLIGFSISSGITISVTIWADVLLMIIGIIIVKGGK